MGGAWAVWIDNEPACLGEVQQVADQPRLADMPAWPVLRDAVSRGDQDRHRMGRQQLAHRRPDAAGIVCNAAKVAEEWRQRGDLLPVRAVRQPQRPLDDEVITPDSEGHKRAVIPRLGEIEPADLHERFGTRKDRMRSLSPAPDGA